MVNKVSRLIVYCFVIDLLSSEAIYRRRRSVSSRGFARTGPRRNATEAEVTGADPDWNTPRWEIETTNRFSFRELMRYHRPPRVRKPAAKHEPQWEQEFAPSGRAVPATSGARPGHRQDRLRVTHLILETLPEDVFRSEAPLLPVVHGTARFSLPEIDWQENRNAESARPEARAAGTGGTTAFGARIYRN